LFPPSPLLFLLLFEKRSAIREKNKEKKRKKKEKMQVGIDDVINFSLFFCCGLQYCYFSK
jgi:hypothetical protein